MTSFLTNFCFFHKPQIIYSIKKEAPQFQHVQNILIVSHYSVTEPRRKNFTYGSICCIVAPRAIPVPVPLSISRFQLAFTNSFTQDVT